MNKIFVIGLVLVVCIAHCAYTKEQAVKHKEGDEEDQYAYLKSPFKSLYNVYTLLKEKALSSKQGKLTEDKALGFYKDIHDLCKEHYSDLSKLKDFPKDHPYLFKASMVCFPYLAKYDFLARTALKMYKFAKKTFYSGGAADEKSKKHK